MRQRIPILASVFLHLGLAMYLCASSISTAQVVHQESSWKSKLYEEVEYEKFACNSTEAQLIADYFAKHKPNRIAPICHNDCPVIKCRAKIPYPPLAKLANVTGVVLVHILVNDQGKTLYARVLRGNPLFWAATRKAACDSQFHPLPGHIRQSVTSFGFELSNSLLPSKNDLLEPPTCETNKQLTP